MQFNKDIAHRDITPNNFGQLKGRGYLYDFSAAKVSNTAGHMFARQIWHACCQCRHHPANRSVCHDALCHVFVTCI